MRPKICLAVLALVLGLGAVWTPAPASAATAVPVDYSIQHAVSYAYAHGYRTAISVLDTSTGAYWQGGSSSAFASESVVKVLIATEILLNGEMYGSTATTAYKMITQSDDASADRLYGLAGGDGVIDRVEAHYHLNIGYRPSFAGWWGNTHLYARGLVYFYNAVRHDPRVWPWLGNAMHHSTVHGSDGFYQHFGIPSATSSYAIKQGWGIDDDCFCHASLNSTGFVNSDRYAVAILTSGPESTYSSAISAMVTSEAKLLMPARYLDIAANHSPHAAMWWVRAYGSELHIMGWAIDPDARTTRLTMHVYDNGHYVRSLTTDWYYAALNARWPGSSGPHGYYVTGLQVANGRHAICVRAFNVGYGTTNPLHCLSVVVNGSPGGYLDSVTAGATQSVRLTGWAIDREHLWAYSTSVTVYDTGRYVGTYPAATPRADVDAHFHITGSHGFVVTLAHQTPGLHHYTVYAVNTGYPNPDVLLPGRTGTIGVRPPAPTKLTTLPAHLLSPGPRPR